MSGQHQSPTQAPLASDCVAATAGLLVLIVTLANLIFRTDFWMLSNLFLVITYLYVGAEDPAS